GVVAGKPVMRGFYDWIGVSNEYVLRGKNAGMFRESEKFSDTERAKFEEFIKSTYDDFITKVGQGRVWTGQQGKERGLVDEYGGLDKALEIAKQLANIPADKSIQRVTMPIPPTFFEQLMSAGDDDAAADAQAKQQASLLSALPEDLREGFRYAQLLDRAAKGEPIYMMPFRLRIK